MRPLRGLALALLICCAAGCGLLSRDALATRELVPSVPDSRLAELRATEPLVPAVWLASLSRAPTPEAALELLAQARSHLPEEPQLLAAEIALLGEAGRWREQRDRALLALGSAPAADLETALRAYVVDADLALGEATRAADDAARLAACPGTPPAFAASAFARVALALESRALAEEADQAFDDGLDLGPGGLPALHAALVQDPSQLPAGTALLERALARHPRHPDVLLAAALGRLLAGQPAEAQDLIEALPLPLPLRLEADVDIVRARLDLAQGRHEAGVQRLLARLDARPDDGLILALLVETWRRYGVPSPEQLRPRLAAGLPLVRDPALAGYLRGALQELDVAR